MIPCPLCSQTTIVCVIRSSTILCNAEIVPTAGFNPMLDRICRYCTVEITLVLGQLGFIQVFAFLTCKNCQGLLGYPLNWPLLSSIADLSHYTFTNCIHIYYHTLYEHCTHPNVGEGQGQGQGRLLVMHITYKQRRVQPTQGPRPLYRHVILQVRSRYYGIACIRHSQGRQILK